MDGFRLAGFAIAGAALVLLLRRMRPELGLAAAMAAGLLLLAAVAPMLGSIAGALSTLAQTGGVEDAYMTQLLKIGGVSLLMDFAAQTCRDAGEEGLAMKTELAGRVMLLSLAMPAVQTLLGQIMSLSP